MLAIVTVVQLLASEWDPQKQGHVPEMQSMSCGHDCIPLYCSSVQRQGLACMYLTEEQYN